MNSFFFAYLFLTPKLTYAELLISRIAELNPKSYTLYTHYPAFTADYFRFPTTHEHFFFKMCVSQTIYQICEMKFWHYHLL